MKDQNIGFSVKGRLQSFMYAFRGLAFLIKTQHNSWIHMIAAVLVVIAGFYFRISIAEWLFVIFAIGFVFTAELFNTAIECLVNLVSPENQDKAGRIKDIAAGAVLVASLTALVAGLIIFLPKIL